MKLYSITYTVHDAIDCSLYSETMVTDNEKDAKKFRENYIEDIKSGLEPLDLECLLTDCPTNPDVLTDIKFTETYGNSNSYLVTVETHYINEK